MIAVLPTLLTLGNAVCGFGAITITAKVGPENFGGSELLIAAQLIFLAMVFDALDGSAARLTRQTSEFGAYLDSLCDAVSFGVAPAFLMLQLTHPAHLLMNSVADVPVSYPPRLLWAIGALFMTCAILRLARFNAETGDDDDHEEFSGLPSPAAAGVIASMPIGLHGVKNLLSDGSDRTVDAVNQWILPATAMLLPWIALATAVLMVSRIRYPHVFNQLLRQARNRRRMVRLLFALALIFVVREMALPVLLCWFAFSTPIAAIWKRRMQKFRRNSTPPPTDSSPDEALSAGHRRPEPGPDPDDVGEQRDS